MVVIFASLCIHFAYSYPSLNPLAGATLGMPKADIAAAAIIAIAINIL
jgi:hypothetical protein